MRFYSGLDTCIFFHLSCLSAVIHDVVGVLHDCLVTAAAQGQFYCVARKFKVLRICQAVQSETETEGDSHLISHVDFFDILQDIKM